MLNRDLNYVVFAYVGRWSLHPTGKVLGVEYELSTGKLTRLFATDFELETFVQCHKTSSYYSSFRDDKGIVRLKEWTAENTQIVYDVGNRTVVNVFEGANGVAFAVTSSDEVLKLDAKSKTGSRFTGLKDYDKRHLIQISSSKNYLIVVNDKCLHTVSLSTKKKLKVYEDTGVLDNCRRQDISDYLFNIT